MKNTTFFANYFNDMFAHVKNVNNQLLEQSKDIIHDASKGNKKIIIVGNGGSASIASHLSVDFTKAAKIRCVNFNEASLITCYANDYGYENWVSSALKSYADQGDVLILISSSGSSENIIQGAIEGKKLDLKIITFSGFSKDNSLRNLGHINFWVNSSNYNYVEMSHHIWLLSLVDKLVEENLIL